MYSACLCVLICLWPGDLSPWNIPDFERWYIYIEQMYLKKVIHHRPIRFFTGSIYRTTKQNVFHHQWLGIFVLPLAPRDFVIAITKSSRFYISNAWELVWMPENNSCSGILFSQQKYDIMRWDIQFVYSLFLGEGWQGNMELMPILISDKTAYCLICKTVPLMRVVWIQSNFWTTYLPISIQSQW